MHAKIMLKINRSILIICIVSLFLIIGQISASDTDSMEINDTIHNDLSLNQLNGSDIDNLESDEMKKTTQTETETIDEIVEEKKRMLWLYPNFSIIAMLILVFSLAIYMFGSILGEVNLS